MYECYVSLGIASEIPFVINWLCKVNYSGAILMLRIEIQAQLCMARMTSCR